MQSPLLMLNELFLQLPPGEGAPPGLSALHHPGWLWFIYFPSQTNSIATSHGISSLVGNSRSCRGACLTFDVKGAPQVYRAYHVMP